MFHKHLILVFQKRTTDEAKKKFLPSCLGEQIKLIVEECLDQYKRENSLLHCQRVKLVRGLITYLYRFGKLPEKYILCLSIHEVAQAIMNLQMNLLTDEGKIELKVEPWKGECLFSRIFYAVFNIDKIQVTQNYIGFHPYCYL